MKRPVCAVCRAEQDKWTHMSPETARRIMQPGIRIGNGAAYDDTPAGMAANRRRRVDDFYALVRRQHVLIADSCEKNAHLALDVAA